jgi:hypothetical protein
MQYLYSVVRENNKFIGYLRINDIIEVWIDKKRFLSDSIRIDFFIEKDTPNIWRSFGIQKQICGVAGQSLEENKEVSIHFDVDDWFYHRSSHIVDIHTGADVHTPNKLLENNNI